MYGTHRGIQIVFFSLPSLSPSLPFSSTTLSIPCIPCILFTNSYLLQITKRPSTERPYKCRWPSLLLRLTLLLHVTIFAAAVDTVYRRGFVPITYMRVFENETRLDVQTNVWKCRGGEGEVIWWCRRGRRGKRGSGRKE